MKKLWSKIKTFFKDSETIFWARLNSFVGIISGALVYVYNDPTINQAIQSALKPQYVPFYLIGFGLLTEVLRRRRDSL